MTQNANPQNQINFPEDGGQPSAQEQQASTTQQTGTECQQPHTPQTPLPPITPKAEQPNRSMSDTGVVSHENNGAQASGSPLPPQGYQQPAQQSGQFQQNGQQQNQQNQQPQNNGWSFLQPAGNNKDSAPFTLLSRLGWFTLGFVGGFFGMLGAWLMAGSLPPERRKQAVNTTWLGFLCQAILVLIYMLMGGAFPFAPMGATQTVSTSSTGAFG